MTRKLLSAVTVAVALVIALSAGATYAYWASTGSGSGAASVDATQSVTVRAAAATPSSQLIPGGDADLVVELTNPNSYAVKIVAISQTGTTVTPVGGTGPGTACSTSNTGVTVPAQTGLNIPVASGSDVVVHLPHGVAMSIASASGCQGATFRVPVIVSVQR